MAKPHFANAPAERQNPVRVLLAGPNVGRPVDQNRDAVLEAMHRMVVQKQSDPHVTIELLQEVDALVLECADASDAIVELIPKLKKAWPRLNIILINGGLTQRQKCLAFRGGVQDYFPPPSNKILWELLGERISNLAQRRVSGPKFRRREPRLGPKAGPSDL